MQRFAADAIELDPGQQSKVQALIDAGAGPGRGFSFGTGTRQNPAGDEEQRRQLEEILTAAQRGKLKDLLGPAFQGSLMPTLSRGGTRAGQTRPPAVFTEPTDLIVSNATSFTVTITTKMTLPNNGKSVGRLRIWHGLPTSRPWDGLGGAIGATMLSFRPETGRVQHLAENNSQHVFWEFDSGLAPGANFTVESRFQVRSADRGFRPDRASAKWSDFPVYAARKSVDEKLAAVVDPICNQHEPAAAALEFCKWITKNLSYDAGVSYQSTDLGAILEQRKGHCGHQMSLFQEMCARARIPVRTARGMNLRAADGNGDGVLNKTRADFENRHTWAEIYLPGSGWVEIDPGAGDNAYRIPAQLVQNSSDFQVYTIWMEEDRQWNHPDWEYRDGKWVSPYQLESVITFSRDRSSDRR